MANIPFFYHQGNIETNKICSLAEETARHIVQVLRMQVGAQLILCNGQGLFADCIIHTTGKKSCDVLVQKTSQTARDSNKLHLAVAFTKNSSRNEWILEKATELGVQSIIPIQAERSEKERVKPERWHNILVSAMLQSQQYFLPSLHEVLKVEQILNQFQNCPQKLMAHCDNQYSRQPISELLFKKQESIILIGPEGDFSKKEIELAESLGFKGISLCEQRLRTETAAISVCAYYNLLA